MRKYVWKTLGALGYIIQYGCVAHCIVEHVGDIVLCSGSSMEPTISSEDILLTERITPKWGNIQRGDIVISKCVSNPKINVCKRIVGLPGDKIKIGIIGSEIVPIGHVWLEGDNASNSSDSRDYGPVPQGLVKSRAIIKVWPLNHISIL